jgi:hypothetical protein
MNKSKIGTNAGKIMKRLEGELTDTSTKNIKKECSMKDLDFYLALGWLAREDKIKFYHDNNSAYLFPIV